ncbi:hypothetical protein DPMN_047926 [Dreissena polymorpha]|uniref:Uncharacterized protein n=1 Tax=Dreissena polymorpha TaxID=45954 RepID=A0A9D4I3I5_DREPO|nr:hypothetical protein DPMN_047926 [Dreissena polymorpha]
MENCPVPLAAMSFNGPEPFEHNSRISETNVLAKFYEDWTKIVTSRVFKCFHYIHIKKTTIFSLVRDINKINVLTKFHDDLATFVTSRVFTKKTSPPTCGHVFQRTVTTFELNQHIIKTNMLTNFKLDRSIIGTNLLTKFHEDRRRHVAFRMFTSKTAPPTSGHVFQRTRTTFELNLHIIKTNILTNFKPDRGIIWPNLLTKFHEDRTRNVAYRVFTRFLFKQYPD